MFKIDRSILCKGLYSDGEGNFCVLGQYMLYRDLTPEEIYVWNKDATLEDRFQGILKEVKGLIITDNDDLFDRPSSRPVLEHNILDTLRRSNIPAKFIGEYPS